MNVYAHRGASIEFPENTISAFQGALVTRCFGIELDVHLSRDGVAVVIHDWTVDRTTDGNGSVSELTLADLKALDAGNGDRIPALAEVLDLVGSAMHVDIEVKADAAADAVIREVERRSAVRWAVSSFDHDVLRYIRSKSAGIELWPLVEEVGDAAVATAQELASPFLAVNDRFMTQEIADELKRNMIGAWVWTVNDPLRASTLRSWSVWGVCTDDPGTIGNALEPSQLRLTP